VGSPKRIDAKYRFVCNFNLFLQGINGIRSNEVRAITRKFFFYEFHMETRHAFKSKIISNLYSSQMMAGYRYVFLVSVSK
jgi:hypothetical protein